MFFQLLIGITDISVCAQLFQPVQGRQKSIAHDALLFFDGFDLKFLLFLLFHPAEAFIEYGTQCAEGPGDGRQADDGICRKIQKNPSFLIFSSS